MSTLERPDQPITTKRAAELSGLAESTIRRAMIEGKLWSKLVGRDRRTTRRELDAYLQRRGTKHPGPLPRWKEGYVPVRAAARAAVRPVETQEE